MGGMPCLVTGELHSVGINRRNCEWCRRAYRYRERKTIKYKLRNKKRYNKLKNTTLNQAKKKVYSAVRNGVLPKIKTQICVDCGSAATVYDHRDYLRPLDVEPVCHKCNHRRGPAKNYFEIKK